MECYSENKQKILKYIKTDKNKKGYYKNILTLDTESSNIVTDTNKYGICYLWQFGIDDNVIYGRELDELKELIDTISYYRPDKTAVVYVQNLGHDFQFLRNILGFTDIFAREQREVLKCRYRNFEFRDLYALTGMSLEELGKINKLKYQKTHDLDYSKIRHTSTPLSEEELEYGENDILVMYEYIKYMLSLYGNFKNIPITFTGITRKEFKKFISENYTGHRADYAVRDWKDYVNKMAPTPKQFRNLMKVYAGGYCHSNPIHTNKLLKNVKSIDYTSSYAYCLFSEKYPVNCFWQDFNANLNNLDFENRSYILKLKFYNIRTKGFLSTISYDKIDIKNTHGVIVDNGRIDTARELITTVNELDYQIITKYYDFDDVELLECYSSKKDYLPEIFLEFVKEKYAKKQLLKPFKNDKPKEYNLAKISLNALYGMCVTNYIHDEITCDNEWNKRKISDDEIDKLVNEMRTNKTNLLPISWGVWCSAYARYNILSCAFEFDDYNVVYIDTDSIKYFDNDFIPEIIENYNKNCIKKVQYVCNLRGIKYENLEGLGEFDIEPNCKEFKTLGAKKYCYKCNDNSLHLALSGVNKEKGIGAINNVDDFSPMFNFSKEFTGKLGRAYNDDQEEITVTDFIGNSKKIRQKYGICLYPVEYFLDITGEYTKVLKKYSNTNNLNYLY